MTPGGVIQVESFEQALNQSYADVRRRLRGPYRPVMVAASAKPPEIQIIKTPVLEPMSPNRTALLDAWRHERAGFPCGFSIRPPDPDFPFAAPRLSVNRIVAAVAFSYGLSMMDLMSARRTANIVRPRQIAMWLAKTLTPRSLPDIGRRVGGRDHTTVLHAVRKIDRLRRDSMELQAELDALVAMLENPTLA